MYRFLIFISFFASALSFAQTTQKFSGEYEKFYKGEDLFEKEQFGSARKMFRDFINQKKDPNDPMYIKALYYEASAALNLYNNDAILLLEDFNKQYPENIYRKKIYFNIGKYYYQQKQYKKTIEWFTQLTKFDLDSTDRNEYFFKLGHSYFKRGNFDDAKLALVEVKDGTSAYANPALYFFSHISYQQQHYQMALDGFLKLENDTRFSKIVPYYITQIYYLLGDYEKVTATAKGINDSLRPSNVNDMNQLIGDAFYRTNQFDEAVSYLEKYNQTHRTSRQEDYQLGYAYFKINNYAKAIKNFNKVIDTKDSLSQITFYNIAECYLRQEDLFGAREAFGRASELHFDPKISEDALYNYAIISYKIDVNPYNEAVLALQDYLDKYPNSDRSNQVYRCLVSVYTRTHRFQDALNSLSNRDIKDIRLKKAYQTVAFNLAVEKFQNGQYQDAINTFQLTRKYPIDEVVVNKGYYWTADAYFRMKDVDKSIEYFESFLKYPGSTTSGLRDDALYNLGYCYLEKKNYDKEESSFLSYIGNRPQNQEKLFDAYMRLGDVSYILKKNDAAISYFSKAIEFNNPEKDHAYYYMALTYGLQDNGTDKKIDALNQLIQNFPRSSYMLTSIYELGVTYRSIGNNKRAITYFDRIINEYPTSNYVLPAKLNKASAYFDMKDFATAEDQYKLLLSAYPANDEVCKTGIEGLKSIYIAQHNLDKVSTLKIYPCAKDIANQVEDTYYEQAISTYLVQDTNYAETIKNANLYLDKFPQGKYVAELTSYLANSYLATGEQPQALATYEKLLSLPDNGFTEVAASYVSKYYYNKGNYENAKVNYTRLKKVSLKVDARFQAEIGLMRTNYLLKNYGDAAEAAQEVVNNSLITKEILNEANYVIGTSNYFLKNYSMASAPLQSVVKDARNVTANESQFYLAQIAFDEDKLDESEEDIRYLLKIKPAYDYWIAKGLILQTKISMKRNDLFKAEQTLRSVIDHYQVKDDGILVEANDLLAELNQLKNMPKKLENESNNVIELDESNEK